MYQTKHVSGPDVAMTANLQPLMYKAAAIPKELTWVYNQGSHLPLH